MGQSNRTQTSGRLDLNRCQLPSGPLDSSPNDKYDVDITVDENA